MLGSYSANKIEKIEVTIQKIRLSAIASGGAQCSAYLDALAFACLRGTTTAWPQILTLDPSCPLNPLIRLQHNCPLLLLHLHRRRHLHRHRHLLRHRSLKIVSLSRKWLTGSTLLETAFAVATSPVPSCSPRRTSSKRPLNLITYVTMIEISRRRFMSTLNSRYIYGKIVCVYQCACLRAFFFRYEIIIPQSGVL